MNYEQKLSRPGFIRPAPRHPRAGRRESTR